MFQIIILLSLNSLFAWKVIKGGKSRKQTTWMPRFHKCKTRNSVFYQLGYNSVGGSPGGGGHKRMPLTVKSKMLLTMQHHTFNQPVQTLFAVFETKREKKKKRFHFQIITTNRLLKFSLQIDKKYVSMHS